MILALTAYAMFVLGLCLNCDNVRLGKFQVHLEAIHPESDLFNNIDLWFEHLKIRTYQRSLKELFNVQLGLSAKKTMEYNRIFIPPTIGSFLHKTNFVP